jgi:hypothetical protein
MGSIDFMPTCFLVEVEGATPDDLETRLENLKDEAFKRKAREVLRNIKRLPPPGRSSWFLGELHLGDESEQ